MNTRREDGESGNGGDARKVNNSTFVWAIGLLSGMMLAGFGWCFNALAAATAHQAATDARVTTFIDSGNVSTQNILLSLGKLQVDVEWIRRQMDAQESRKR